MSPRTRFPRNQLNRVNPAAQTSDALTGEVASSPCDSLQTLTWASLSFKASRPSDVRKSAFWSRSTAREVKPTSSPEEENSACGREMWSDFHRVKLRILWMYWRYAQSWVTLPGGGGLRKGRSRAVESFAVAALVDLRYPNPNLLTVSAVFKLW